MFYSHILKMNIGRAAKNILPFVDALLAALILMLTERWIISLFCSVRIEAIGVPSMGAVLALMRAERLVRGEKTQPAGSAPGKTALGILIIGILGAVITAVCLTPREGITTVAAAGAVGLLSALLGLVTVLLDRAINGSKVEKS